MKKPNFAAMNPAVAEAIKQMMAEQGDKFSLEKINLADLGRRTGISRAKLRRMKVHDFEDVQHALKGRKATTTLLSGYESSGVEQALLSDSGIPQQPASNSCSLSSCFSPPSTGMHHSSSPPPEVYSIDIKSTNYRLIFTYY